jgi:hypothetical protein
MNKRLSILAMVFAILLGTFAPVPANAETTLGAQVLQSDLTLTKANSPYVVNGLIQIPAGKVLIIEPGAVVTFVNGGGIKSLGEVRVGSINSTERVILNLKTNLDFIGNGLVPPNVSIARTDIYGQNSFLVYGCGKLQIDESYLEKISSIVREQECNSLSLKNSYLNSVINVYQGFFDGYPSYFVMQNNKIVSMEAICCYIKDRTMGALAAQSTYIYNVSNNEFKNLENLNIPFGYINYTFTNNNLTNVKNVRIVRYFGYFLNSKTEVISSNYWGGLSSDSAIRSAIKVVDGKSDIAVQRTIVFEPVATSPVVLVGFPMTKQMSIDKAALDKAAADKAIADAKAIADKAAADKAIADKAAADKAIADAKAYLDKVAADKAAADALANAAAQKKKTLTCVKGKLTKKVTAVNPKCPAGYKPKK